jgi:lactate racemase
MKKYELPYGKDGIQAFETELPVTILTPNRIKAGDSRAVIDTALKRPVDAPNFEEFIAKVKKLLLIVNDATRPTPTDKVLAHIQPALVKVKELTVMVATGAHRAPTEDEYKLILGPAYDSLRQKCIAHNARNDAEMVYLGKSANGTEMYLNKAVKEHDGIVIIGSVEPHYFAGYTGGRKSFLPGIASYKTIEMNHKAALSEKAAALALAGNPVHDDMIDAMRVLKDLRVFSIQTVLTADHGIYAVTAGDLHTSFDAAVTRASEVFCAELKARADIVISAAPYPMDIDFFQSQKALDNGKLALKRGGVIITVSKCREGVGENAFLTLLDSKPDVKGVLEEIAKGYKLGYHKAAKIAQIGLWAKMYAVMGIDDATVRRAKLEPFPSVQNALDAAVAYIRAAGIDKPTIILMPQGSLAVPLLRVCSGVGPL